MRLAHAERKGTTMTTKREKRAALYLRVSTDGQTVDNQRLELEQAASQRGWHVVTTYADEGISGSKGREKRPGLDKMLKDATRGRFDVVMSWAVDRLGRSLPDLINTLSELHHVKVDLFLHQQAIDTTTPTGRMVFQLMGVFAEFERSMIVARVHAGLARARTAGRIGGRPKMASKLDAAVRASLASGVGTRATARAVGVSSSAVQRIKGEMASAGR
jgi:DNA invertase Pin-like site-specific DNA recombinase